MAIGFHFEIPYQVPFILPDGRLDPHHWMKDNKEAFEKSVQKTHKVTQNYLFSLNELKEKIIKEMESNVEIDFSSKSKKVGKFLYYVEYEGKNEYPTYFRQDLDTGKKEKLHNWGSKTVINFIPSPRGNYVLFVLDDKGTQFGDIIVYDCVAHKIHTNEIISNNNGNIVWDKKCDAFWYASANPLRRTDRVLYHKIGTSPEMDNTVFQELDIRYEVEVLQDRLNTFILSSSIDSSDLSIFLSHKLETLIPRNQNVLINLISGLESTYLLIHEKNGSGDLYELNENFDFTLLYHEEKDYLVNATPLKDFFLLEKRRNGLPAIEVLSKKSRSSFTIDVPPGKIEIVDIEYNQSAFTLLHSSPIHPPLFNRFDCIEKKFDLPFKESEKYCITLEYALSDDVQIPVTLVHKKDIDKNKPHPLLIYSYGAYGSVIDPAYFKPYESLLSRDVIIAYAHVRGGGEFGKKWHESGKRLKKINSFKDLIAVSNHLINQGYSVPEKMALQGGSAGGTLAAGILNMKPDLFKVVVLEVPFVDAITDLFDRSVPYTPQEWEEWGNPQNPEELRAIRAWSPIDNLKPSFYPAVYITAGENDVQVLSHEPYKYWAKLLQNQRGKNPILFEMLKGGHKGETGRYSSIRQIAPMYAFLLYQLGLKS